MEQNAFLTSQFEEVLDEANNNAEEQKDSQELFVADGKEGSPQESFEQAQGVLEEKVETGPDGPSNL